MRQVATISTAVRKPPASSPYSDLTAARVYLWEMARACEEGATSPDPRVTVLALEVVRHAGQAV